MISWKEKKQNPEQIMTHDDAISFGLRPPYVTEMASEYFNEVVGPFIRKATTGFSSEHTASSYRVYHWFREPLDCYTVFMVEKEINPSELSGNPR